MQTLILTGQYSPSWEVGRRTIGSKRAWCEQHGYSLIELHGWPQRSFCWQKIELAWHYLESFDVVAWFDADSLITNPHLALSDIINGDFGVNVSHDWNRADALPKAAWFSAGNIVFTAKAAPLFATLATLAARHPDWHEQQALQQAVINRLSGYEQVNVLPGTMLNAVPVELQPQSANPWDPTCLLAHLTSTDEPARLAWIESHDHH